MSKSQDDCGFENRFPVAYASQLLSKSERNYKITDLKGLAVSWATSHFETYIHGMHFAVITYHSDLKALKDKSILTGRLLRRAEKLLEYDFDVVYCSGRGNVFPDFLSRVYMVELTSPVEDERDQEIAKSKNKFFVPFTNRSRLLEKAHRTYTGHLRTAKMFSFMSTRYFGLVCTKT